MSTPAPPSAPPASGLSALFSLSQAAASAPPIPMHASGADQKVSKDMPHHSVSTSVSGKPTHAVKHRRLSSAGQMRRRMSDAREAANRPSLVHSAATALASMSIAPAASTSPVQTHMHTRSRSQAQGDLTGVNTFVVNLKSIPVPINGRRLASGALAKSVPTQDLDLGSAIDDDIEVDVEDDDSASVVGVVRDALPSAKKGKSTGKKRGTIFKCESCSKVYRHPSCLIKHRWEHSPHWREASKFMLSKHQQVQLLEAAAILSHLDTSSSLPEDRSLWPSYLSGGALPPPSTGAPSLVTINGVNSSASRSEAARASLVAPSHPVSSSVPIRPNGLAGRTRSGSVSTTVSVSTSAGGGPGPRMHNYSIPAGGSSGITQIRPGLLGVPTPPSVNTPPSVVTAPAGLSVVPYADEEDDDQDIEEQEYENMSRSGLSVSSPEKPQPMAVPLIHQSSSSSGNGYGSYRDVQHSAGFSFNSSISASVSVSGGGWSLPNSEMRSGSVALSYSEVGSREGSRSDDEVLVSDDEADVDVNGDDGFVSIAGSRPGSTGSVPSPTRIGFGDGFANGDYGNYSFTGRSGWKKDSDDDYTPSGGAYGVSGKDENPTAAQDDEEWVGMDMDMDL